MQYVACASFNIKCWKTFCTGLLLICVTTWCWIREQKSGLPLNYDFWGLERCLKSVPMNLAGIYDGRMLRFFPLHSSTKAILDLFCVFKPMINGVGFHNCSSKYSHFAVFLYLQPNLSIMKKDVSWKERRKGRKRRRFQNIWLSDFTHSWEYQFSYWLCIISPSYE